jgi:hypothetical protein
MENRCFKVLGAFNPVCPQRGPYEASEGIYSGYGRNEKTGHGQGGIGKVMGEAFMNEIVREMAAPSKHQITCLLAGTK